MKNRVVYVDMDGVLVDLQTEIERCGWWHQDIFKNPEPIEGAI